MSRNEESVWNRFSGFYDKFMKRDMSAYEEMVTKISAVIEPTDSVLEIATGTGLIALKLADQVTHIEAVDFSPKMLEKARNKADELGVENVHFSKQDACCLTYEADSFDIVIIANTLHVMPQPDKALMNIKKVLKSEGKLIAPTFIHANSKKAAILSRLMLLTGFRAYHRWTQQSYHAFLDKNGFAVVDSALLNASFPLEYTVAKKK